MHFVTSVRPRVPAGLPLEKFKWNLLLANSTKIGREETNVVKEGPKCQELYMMLRECSLKFLSRRKYIHIYTTLYVEYVSYIYTHIIIDHNYGRGVQRSECPLGHDTCNKFWYVWEECKHCLWCHGSAQIEAKTLQLPAVTINLIPTRSPFKTFGLLWSNIPTCDQVFHFRLPAGSWIMYSRLWRS